MSNLEGDGNRQVHTQRKNVGQSNYNSQSKCALPEDGFSIGDAQVIVTWLELPVPLITAVKKSKVLWNTRRRNDSWSSTCAAAVTHLGAVLVDCLKSGP